MFYTDFEAFSQEAVELFRARPKESRYQIKYREGKLVLKVTDDVKCLQFKTDQQSDFKRLEKLTMQFFSLTSTGEEGGTEEVPMQVDSTSGGKEHKEQGAGSTSQPQQGGGKSKRRKG